MSISRQPVHPPVEMKWDVNGLCLAGLAWGEPGGRPVLALHGWLDNAASFSVLAPKMRGCYVVAPDLTGHGRSAHRSADAGYQIWDDLPELVGILEDLGWEKFALLGHSRGAIIATLLASTYPERVERLILLDGVAPPPVPPELFPTQLRQHIDDKAALTARSARRFETPEAAIAVRQAKGLESSAAHVLAERSLEHGSNGYYWSSDSRLQGASSVKLSEAQIHAVFGALVMPVLLLLAEEGEGRQWMLAQARGRIAKLSIGYCSGGHHFHLQGDIEAAVEQVAAFLDLQE